MLKYGWSRRDRREQEQREPVYCVLTESEVTARWLEMRHVDEKGRIGAVVLDMDGQPIEISVESTHDDMQSFFPGPGRFAVIARNAKGRIEGRNDYTVWQDGGEPLPRNQIEVYRDERDAERKARRAAEADMETVQKRNDELHEALAEKTQRMAAMAAETQRQRDEFGKALADERQRRLDAEEALAALRDLADQAGGLEALARLSHLLARALGGDIHQSDGGDRT